LGYEGRNAGGLCSWQREWFFSNVPGSWSRHTEVFEGSSGLKPSEPQLEILAVFPTPGKVVFKKNTSLPVGF